MLELLERNVNYYVILDDEYDICQNIIHIKEGAYVILLRKKNQFLLLKYQKIIWLLHFGNVFIESYKKIQIGCKRRKVFLK